MGFFRLMRTELGGVPTIVSRTGYTGDLGYEIWVESGDAETARSPSKGYPPAHLGCAHGRR